jgi:hypothetical protein
MMPTPMRTLLEMIVFACPPVRRKCIAFLLPGPEPVLALPVLVTSLPSQPDPSQTPSLPLLRRVRSLVSFSLFPGTPGPLFPCGVVRAPTRYSSSSSTLNRGNSSPHPSHPFQPIAIFSSFSAALSTWSLTTTTSCPPCIAYSISALAAAKRFAVDSVVSVPRPRRRDLRVEIEGGERKRKTGERGGVWRGALERSWRTPWSSMSRMQRRGWRADSAAKVVP